MSQGNLEAERKEEEKRQEKARKREEARLAAEREAAEEHARVEAARLKVLATDFVLIDSSTAGLPWQLTLWAAADSTRNSLAFCRILLTPCADVLCHP